MTYREPRSATILVVEDSSAIRNMVCGMLSQTGYTCLEASDGAEALQLLEGTRDVELVLTDVVMPNMDGTELARRLATVRPDLRILFMSGYTDDALVQSIGRRSPLFLPKPFTASALVEKVNQALTSPPAGRPDSQTGFSQA